MSELGITFALLSFTLKGGTMKRVILTSVLSLFAVGLMGCDPISGSINVREEFKAVATDPNCIPGRDQCSVEKSVKIPTGVLNANVLFRSKREAVLNIKVKNTTQQLVFKIPKDKPIPETNGEFTLTSKESGQPFDLTAGLKTTVENSSQYSGYESCTVTIREQVCYVNPLPNGSTCQFVDHVYQGRQYVEYYYKTTTTVMNAALVKSTSASTLADFNGSKSNSDKIYLRQDPCQIF